MQKLQDSCVWVQSVPVQKARQHEQSSQTGVHCSTQSDQASRAGAKMADVYDLVTIGAGSGGVRASRFATTMVGGKRLGRSSTAHTQALLLQHAEMH